MGSWTILYVSGIKLLSEKYIKLHVMLNCKCMKLCHSRQYVPCNSYVVKVETL